MELTAQDFAILKELEESLWRTGTRFDPEHMNKILSPTFFEFGRSGRIFKREKTLSAKSREINARLLNFEVHPITDEVVLVTYITEVVSSREILVSNRSSLWLKTSSGWQLQFHQGTPANQ